jgi:hypothetical protein
MLIFILGFGLIALVVGLLAYRERQKRQSTIAELLAGNNLLAAWTYGPDEWRQAVESEFTWVRNKTGSSGQCYISPNEIYIRGDGQDHLIDLSSGGRVVTHASYRGADSNSPLKIRVRWKVVPSRENRDEVKYHKEDYRIPVPIQYRDDAARVAAFFTKQIENNLDAYTNVMSDDEPISLFGRDGF